MPSPLLLAVNAGSSSLKLALFRVDVDSHRVNGADDPVALWVTASFTHIATPHAQFSYYKSTQQTIDIADHTAAFEHFLRVLFADERFVSQGYTRQHISHICHRVVHGGLFTDPVIIGEHTFHRIESLSDLAPLHNNRALDIIASCHNFLPGARSVAFFDSAFHSTLQPHIYTYPISPSIAKAKNLRKYGFHGLSYAFILRSVATFLRKSPSETSLIALHLGSGASVCAIRDGRSINTSMGLTPLSGLPGATRSGDVDPSLIFHYTADSEDTGRMSVDRTHEIHVTEAERILNTEAGWKALTGTTDFHQIITSHEPSHKLTCDILVDRICQLVGGYFVQLKGQLDAIVFSGGVGENSPELRKAVLQQCACLGLDIVSDELNEANSHGNPVVYDIGQGKFGIRTLVCRTNEELEIARQCALGEEFWKT